MMLIYKSQVNGEFNSGMVNGAMINTTMPLPGPKSFGFLCGYEHHAHMILIMLSSSISFSKMKRLKLQKTSKLTMITVHWATKCLIYLIKSRNLLEGYQICSLQFYYYFHWLLLLYSSFLLLLIPGTVGGRETRDSRGNSRHHKLWGSKNLQYLKLT